jgi:hemerythrin-like metal-binding protein
MTIARKIHLLLTIAIFALLGMAVISYLNTHRIVNKTNTLITVEAAQQNQSMEALEKLGNAVQSSKNFLLRKDDKYVKEFREHCVAIAEALKKYESLAADDTSRGMAKKASEALSAYTPLIDKLIEAYKTTDNIREIDAGIKGLDKPLAAALHQMDELADKNIKEGYIQLESASRRSLLIQVCIALLTTLTVFVIGMLITRAISIPIRRLAADAERIATGDLTFEIVADSRDEIGDLAQSFQKMINNLREMIVTLVESSSQVAEASGNMQRTAAKMAEGAEEVSEQATAVATAGEEMSSTAGDIAQNCLMAAESATRAIQAASHGADTVDNSIAVMRRIAERVQLSAKAVDELGQRSDQIGSIINTIEDIADQTNLLALNAAIEAARAGEQGRGFAVVADEVRALAERTSRATKEIGKMIKDIQTETQGAVKAMEVGVAEVELGTTEAARSGEALKSIQDEINTVNLQVQQIATASEEQTAVTGEISSNMIRITEISKETVEESRGTAYESQRLTHLSSELQGVVRTFKLSSTSTMLSMTGNLLLGIPSIDSEHQRFIDITNNLFAAMRDGKGNAFIGQTLDELAGYAKSHFTHEESLMQKAGFPGLAEHRRVHDECCRRIAEIQDKFRSGSVLSQEVMSFLKSWLSDHIMGMDRNYVPAMKKNGIR